MKNDFHHPVPACGTACFAAETLIGVGMTAGRFDFKKVSEINTADQVLTTNRAVSGWEPGAVTFAAHDGDSHYNNAICCFFETGGHDPIELVVTGDHLFLGADGKLIPAAHLYPGVPILQFDGSIAVPQFVSLGSYRGRICNLIVGDQAVGADLSGHLINAGGLVCADFALQMAYQYGKVDHKLLAAPSHTPPENRRANKNQAHTDFIRDQSEWPPFFVPVPEQ